MNKTFSAIKTFLHTYGIPFREYLSELGVPAISMRLEGFPDCPEQALEACVFCFRSVVEARCYFTETGSLICQGSTFIPELYRFLNYLNAHIWMNLSDGSGGQAYPSSYLTTCRFYMTEDDGKDICCAIMVPIEHWLAAELQYGDFFTRFMPEIMHKLAPAFFGILMGGVTATEAISYVRKELLHETN